MDETMLKKKILGAVVEAMLSLDYTQFEITDVIDMVEERVLKEESEDELIDWYNKRYDL